MILYSLSLSCRGGGQASQGCGECSLLAKFGDGAGKRNALGRFMQRAQVGGSRLGGWCGFLSFSAWQQQFNDAIGCCLRCRYQVDIGNICDSVNADWRREAQSLWSMWVAGDMAKATDVACNVTLSTVRDVLRQAVPSMFFSVSVGYVTLAALLVSYFPLRRWAQNALQ